MKSGRKPSRLRGCRNGSIDPSLGWKPIGGGDHRLISGGGVFQEGMVNW